MRRTLLYVLALLFGAGACGPTQVVVTMEIEVDDASGNSMITQLLSDIEVRLIPYDRDAAFDSMTAAYSTPEPEVPEALLAARSEVQTAQAEWDAAQRRWGILRDTLQAITSTLEGLERTDAQYILLFREYGDFDAEYASVEREVEAAFADFDSLQQGTISASDSVRILQENWADNAYVDIGDVFSAKLAESGLDIATDTTDASGIARQNLQVSPGQYWVNTRYELTYSELYWNVPLTVGSEPVEIRLTRDNAEERLIL
jgi:hypothetical protein